MANPELSIVVTAYDEQDSVAPLIEVIECDSYGPEDCFAVLSIRARLRVGEPRL